MGSRPLRERRRPGATTSSSPPPIRRSSMPRSGRTTRTSPDRRAASTRARTAGRPGRACGGGLPDGPKTGRIGLAVSWQNPDKAYALVDNLNKDKNQAAELYRTTDGGRTWTRTHAEELLDRRRHRLVFRLLSGQSAGTTTRSGPAASGSPTRPTAAGRSTSSAATSSISSPIRPIRLHLDHCEIWMNPLNPDHLAVGNDGGLYVSEDKGRTWIASQQHARRRVLRHLGRRAGSLPRLRRDPGRRLGLRPGPGVGSEVPRRLELHLARRLVGRRRLRHRRRSRRPRTRSTSPARTGRSAARTCGPTARSASCPGPPRRAGSGRRYNFIAPYILSPHDRFTLYHAGNYVFKSVNRGDAWTLISPDLANSADPARSLDGGRRDRRVSPGARPHLRRHGQGRALGDQERRPRSGPSARPACRIVTSGASAPRASSCPASTSRSRGSTTTTSGRHVFVSEDYGARWTPITGNLPDEVAYGILEDPTNPEILYAGLCTGASTSPRTADGVGRTSARACPAAAVSRLVIQEREMDLLAGTYGRGIYKMNLRPIQAAFKPGPPSADRLFDPACGPPALDQRHPPRPAAEHHGESPADVLSAGGRGGDDGGEGRDG